MNENHFKSEIEEIELEGFKVVSADYFIHRTIYDTPTCTIWPNGLTFNKVSLTALNNCERIRVEINAEKKTLLAIPVTMKDKDSILWRKNVKEYAPKRLESVRFTSTLYDMWSWDIDLTYRAQGRLVSADGKVMLLFDFNKVDTWKGTTRDKRNS